jgi:hypothetical protein
LDAQDIKARLSVAAMTTMAKAQGQEVSLDDQEEMIQQTKRMMNETNATPDSNSSTFPA